MPNWLKDCEICNAGLCDAVAEKKEGGLSERAACREMSDESEGLYSAKDLRGRYRYHTAKDKSGGISAINRATFGTAFTGENEWYTPMRYIDDARAVLGDIDLDPATSEFGQSRIKAKEYYTLEADGLAHPWAGMGT